MAACWTWPVTASVTPARVSLMAPHAARAVPEMTGIWQVGCIIWAQLRMPLREAYEKQPDLPNLMLADSLAPAEC
ncbi:hypothetical protein JQX13_34385 [Archangium violaceum]|uniref:hypothetical protein n=1 Tax=Archangium violaceum TaxID=83451 RepID=UPI00193B1627|nr:hypothetical protein [Archangium violaceum]QRK05256.1 hypothetical protein JQX13_34385 [Archangium violaceum]